MSQGRSPSELENQRLREEVRDLREELRRLTLRVDRQGDQISALSDSVVEGSRSQEPSAISAASAQSETPGSSSATLPPGRSEGPPYSWEYRYEAAREVGRFLRRSLTGGHRGLSGREKIKLQNRCYLVIRDFEGSVYTPVLLVRAYSRVRELCQRNGSWGDSIFVGFPSAQEASVAVSEAGLVWPSESQ